MMSAMPDRPTLYEFDRFTVDAKQRLLFAAGDRAPVDLPPRAFEALLYLVERPGELLSKKELLKALWPGVIVEENSLNQVISLVRKVLGEKPSEHRFIVTAPGRGYRFVAAVHARGEGPEAETDGLSLAVLPFVDRSGVLGNGYLGEAIAADLIRLLSARSRIRVAAHTSSFVFKDLPADARTVAKTLNVAKVLTGQITSDEGQLLVTAQLMDGKNGLRIRTLSQRRAASDLVELQADLAREIALALDPGPSTSVSTSANVHPEAYMRYLRALLMSMAPDLDRVMKSISLLREAVDLEPSFSRAKSLLAIQYTSCVMFGFPFPDALDLARHEVAGALTLDDQNGETHLAAAVIDCLGGAWSRAEERFRIAHALTADPLVSGLRCAYLSLSVGQLERAFQQAEHALRVAPTHPIGVNMLATLFMTRNQNEQALRYANLAVELGQPRTVAPLADILCELAVREGRTADAADYMLATFPPHAHTPELSHTVQLLCRTNPTPAESAAAAAALRTIETSLPAAALDPPLRKRFMLWYSRLGALDHAYALAFDSLDQYAREGTVGGAWGVLWLPEMAAFRDDERFQLFAQRLRLFEYWSEYGPPDGHSLNGARLSKAG
jgi:DNA-binding winged helix-turn-helix (wHTH) protein/tetratricopeptide (TPR) repeat protein